MQFFTLKPRTGELEPGIRPWNASQGDPNEKPPDGIAVLGYSIEPAIQAKVFVLGVSRKNPPEFNRHGRIVRGSFSNYVPEQESIFRSKIVAYDILAQERDDKDTVLIAVPILSDQLVPKIGRLCISADSRERAFYGGHGLVDFRTLEEAKGVALFPAAFLITASLHSGEKFLISYGDQAWVITLMNGKMECTTRAQYEEAERRAAEAIGPISLDLGPNDPIPGPSGGMPT